MLHIHHVVDCRKIFFEVINAVVVNQDSSNESFWNKVESITNWNIPIYENVKFVFAIFDYVSINRNQLKITLESGKEKEQRIVYVSCGEN